LRYGCISGEGWGLDMTCGVQLSDTSHTVAIPRAQATLRSCGARRRSDARFSFLIEEIGPKGRRNNNLDKAAAVTPLGAGFESVVPIWMCLMAADAEFFHLGLCHFDTRFVLVGVENCFHL